MNFKEIQELVKLVKKSDLCELQVKDGEFSVTIKNRSTEQPTVIAAPMAMPAINQAATRPLTQNEENFKGENTPQAGGEPANDKLVTFRSPMVGTFYRKPGSDKDPYVKVGDNVKAGDTICIIEAMKLFNEIEFDGEGGRVVKILADDASPVEYDQPLFLIEKL